MKSYLRLSTSVFAALVLALSVSRVFADDVIAKSYDIKNVLELVVSGGGRVQITQGDTESLRVEAAADVMDRVRVDLSGGKLDLSVKYSSKKSFSFFRLFYNHHDDDVLYVLQLKKLTYLGLSGASRATFGDWVGGNMSVNVSGAGAVNFASLQVNDLFVQLTGASNSKIQNFSGTKARIELSGAANMDVKAAGKVNVLEINASGASNYRGKLLNAVSANVEASGASNIDLQVSESLRATASGASNIHYLGHPRMDSNASGASNIKSISN